MAHLTIQTKEQTHLVLVGICSETHTRIPDLASAVLDLFAQHPDEMRKLAETLPKKQQQGRPAQDPTKTNTHLAANRPPMFRLPPGWTVERAQRFLREEISELPDAPEAHVMGGLVSKPFKGDRNPFWAPVPFTPKEIGKLLAFCYPRTDPTTWVESRMKFFDEECVEVPDESV